MWGPLLWHTDGANSLVFFFGRLVWIAGVFTKNLKDAHVGSIYLTRGKQAKLQEFWPARLGAWVKPGDKHIVPKPTLNLSSSHSCISHSFIFYLFVLSSIVRPLLGKHFILAEILRSIFCQPNLKLCTAVCLVSFCDAYKLSSMQLYTIPALVKEYPFPSTNHIYVHVCIYVFLFLFCLKLSFFIWPLLLQMTHSHFPIFNPLMSGLLTIFWGKQLR